MSKDFRQAHDAARYLSSTCAGSQDRNDFMPKAAKSVDMRLAEICEALGYEPPVLKAPVSEPANDGWIDWKGGECPVAGGVTGSVKFGDGRVAHNQNLASWGGNWFYHSPAGSSGRIIRYRLDAPVSEAQTDA